MPRTNVSELSLAIATQLRAEIARQKASKSGLADEIGVHRTHFSRIVNGRVSTDIDTLDKICSALGMDFTKVYATARRSLAVAELRDRLDDNQRPTDQSDSTEQPSAS